MLTLKHNITYIKAYLCTKLQLCITLPTLSKLTTKRIIKLSSFILFLYEGDSRYTFNAFLSMLTQLKTHVTLQCFRQLMPTCEYFMTKLII